MNQTRNRILGSLLPSMGAAVALLAIGGPAPARAQAQAPWLGVSNVQSSNPSDQEPTSDPALGERAEVESGGRAAKVHGTITVDFEKVTIAELLRLTQALEQIDGVIHIVSTGGEDVDDRAVVTITRPGGPALILGEEEAARDQAQLLDAATPPTPPTSQSSAPERSTTSAFPRLAALGRRLGFQGHHHQRARARLAPSGAPAPTTVTWEPRSASAGSDKEVMRASGDAADPTSATAPEAEPLEVGARLDALSAGRPLSSVPAVDATTSTIGPQVQATNPSPNGQPLQRIAKADDSFESLSRTFYGDARYARALWWANRDEVAWPGALAAGKRLVIPAPGELEPRMIVAPDPKSDPTKPPRDPGVQLASFERSTAESEEGRDEGGFSIHVVRPDDTLRIIAREICGDEQKAMEIIALNRDILTPEGRIRVGQRLLMPVANQP